MSISPEIKALADEFNVDANALQGMTDWILRRLSGNDPKFLEAFTENPDEFMNVAVKKYCEMYTKWCDEVLNSPEKMDELCNQIYEDLNKGK